MNHLERQYLLAAYGLTENTPSRVFNEDEITNHLDLDPSEPGFVERFVSLTQYLLDSGFLAPYHKGGGTGRRTLHLTVKGLEEAKRLADPVEQRKERRRIFLRTVYELADGNSAKYVYWQDVAPRIGWDPTDDEHLEQGLALADYAERSKLITIEANEGTIYRITEKGVDVVEGNKPPQEPSVSNTVNISGGNFYSSAVGTNNIANLSAQFDFRSIEQRIESETGPDREELRELVAEMREVVERGDTLDRNFLSRYNDKLKEYDWLSSAVAGWLLNFATSGMG